VSRLEPRLPICRICIPGGFAGSLQTAIPRGSAARRSLRATRPLKNLMSARGGGSDHLPVLRRGPGGVDQQRAGRGGWLQSCGPSRRCPDYPTAHLVRAGWASWHDHRKTVARMNLLINCSYTESFNMVTADGSLRDPSVVSDAIGLDAGPTGARRLMTSGDCARGAASGSVTCSLRRWLPRTADAQRRRTNGMESISGP